MRVGIVCAMMVAAPVASVAGEPVLEWAPEPGGPWTEDAEATIEEIGPNQWQIVTPLSLGEATASTFYRLVVAEGFEAIELTSCQVVDSSLEMEAVGTPSTGPQERTITLPGDVPLVLVRIPAGSFQMGSPDTERSRWIDEGPVHTVTIGYAFYLGKYEVTQAQWVGLMGSWPGRAPDPAYGAGAAYPAYALSWNDAQSFIAALNSHLATTGQGPLMVRLPSEAEWEYACRAGTSTRFYFGDSLGVADVCEDDGVRSQYMWYCGNANHQTHPVGTKLPNAFGLYDMHGNVWEWCEDWYHSSYSGAPADGSAWVSPTHWARVVRGAYWLNYARHCRSAIRSAYAPIDGNTAFGFRVAAVQ